MLMKFVLGGSLYMVLQLTMLVAEANDQLYAPEPPVDSSYMRVINAGHHGAVDVLVDDKLRLKRLAVGNTGEYLILPMGKHQLQVRYSEKVTIRRTIDILAESGHSTTVAFVSLLADEKPFIFEDKPNSNRLKATLSVYHLNPNFAGVDVMSADGKVTVFSNVVAGTSKNILVNPIKIELIAAKSGHKEVEAHAKLAMTPGGVYSVLLLPNEHGGLSTKVVQNKVERYTDK